MFGNPLRTAPARIGSPTSQAINFVSRGVALIEGPVGGMQSSLSINIASHDPEPYVATKFMLDGILTSWKE